MTTILQRPAADYLRGAFVVPDERGMRIESRNPARPQEVIWSGWSSVGHVDRAVEAAAHALASWADLGQDGRLAYLRRWKEVTTQRADEIATLITREMGKVYAESLAEAKALGAKVDLTLEKASIGRVSEFEVNVSPTRKGVCRFKPHGVMAVIGPFNFPAHLANGHFVPALLLGNTIVFKPSEKTPGVGQIIAQIMDEIGLPPGVFNVVQGAADVARRLVAHPAVDGILFTGSWPVGRRILEANLDSPGRIVALEMGGNNPVVIMPSANLKQAAVECARAAFNTTGQRCTCTRRIIVHRAIADRFISALGRIASNLVVGPGLSKEPVFTGPIVSEAAMNHVLQAQERLVKQGGRIVLQSTRMEGPLAEGWFITPGIVEVDRFTLETDEEIFGPIAQVSVVDSLDEAIRQANATRYGLAASIFSTDRNEWEAFFRGCRAGCINWNNGTAGASSALPFGGLGLSGNHRPAGAFSVDYCAYPIASMLESGADVAIPAGMRWEDAWDA
jgi:succinylglutamic semialdehyde dehydrogenase